MIKLRRISDQPILLPKKENAWPLPKILLIGKDRE